MSKLKSYLGLCKKSNSLVIGQDKLKACKKYPYIIVVSPNATDNLKDLAIRLSNKFHCMCVMSLMVLEDLINIPNCKIVGVSNINLSHAIEKCEEEYSILRSNND